MYGYIKVRIFCRLRGTARFSAWKREHGILSLNEEGRTYEWTVPDGATINSGQGTNEIVVDWGCAGGQVQCHLGTACDQYDLSLDVTNKEYAINGPFFLLTTSRELN